MAARSRRRVSAIAELHRPRVAADLGLGIAGRELLQAVPDVERRTPSSGRPCSLPVRECERLAERQRGRAGRRRVRRGWRGRRGRDDAGATDGVGDACFASPPPNAPAEREPGERDRRDPAQPHQDTLSTLQVILPVTFWLSRIEPSSTAFWPGRTSDTMLLVLPTRVPLASYTKTSMK